MKLASFALFLASHAAFFALPAQVELAGSILFAAGLLAFAASDYSGRPAAARAEVRPLAA